MTSILRQQPAHARRADRFARDGTSAMALLAIAGAIALALPLAARAQQGDGTSVGFPVNIFKPEKVPATPERIAALKVPTGFKVTAFATGLKNARVVAVAPDGTVYVSRREQGDVIMLKDSDGDGKADGPPVVVAARSGAHGLAIHDGKLYLVTVKELFVADIRGDGMLGPLTLLAGDLPDAGQHANRTIAFGPDGLLYLSAGSTCNACNESNPENATILRFSRDFKSRTIFASGLRNTIGFSWQPATGELWGLDHGIDFLGDEVQPEELNHIQFGKQYGWPHVWGDGTGSAAVDVSGMKAGSAYRSGGFNPQSTPVGAISKETWRSMSLPMTLGWAAHAAPMQLLFYSNGSFPAEFDGDAFATFRGSWNRNPAAGYEIVRIRFDPKSGQPAKIEPFVSGFLTDGGKTHIARPVGLAMAKDGALLMADDANGVLYRIAYSGPGRRRAGLPAAPPAGPMVEAFNRGNGLPLAFARVDATAPAGGGLALRSTAFADGGALEPRYSSYADDVSPALEWQGVAGARSYAVLVEDPDAKPVAPVVHWLAWNIPAATTSLPAGLQKTPRLTEPDGLLQGRNVHGSTGWFGPHPPVGDAPHHYNFEVFALDTVLDILPGSDRETVLAAAQGHVIGKARIVGTYQQLQPPLK